MVHGLISHATSDGTVTWTTKQQPHQNRSSSSLLPPSKVIFIMVSFTTLDKLPVNA
jgi:hypothetical protein